VGVGDRNRLRHIVVIFLVDLLFMKKYLFIVLLIGFWGCEDNEDCIDESKISDASICSEEAQPVCGCDGLTYGNACNADKAGVTEWIEGECE